MEGLVVKKILTTLSLAVLLFAGAVGVVFADDSKPVIDFTDSGAGYDQKTGLLRFNFVWSATDSDGITVMYSINEGDTNKLGKYENGQNKVIAHLYLDNYEAVDSYITLHAVDSNGMESEEKTVKVKTGAGDTEVIEDEMIPLSSSEGTWSLINLFLTSISAIMCAVTIMLFFENRFIRVLRYGGKVKSSLILLLSIFLACGNIVILLKTQSLRHEMVMVDEMTVTMLLITVLSVATTATMAVRAYRMISAKEIINEV